MTQKNSFESNLGGDYLSASDTVSVEGGAQGIKTQKSKRVKKPRREKPMTRPTGMKWKIFAYLAIFTAFVLAVLWLFQVVLLDDIYQSIMLSKMKKATNEIASSIESDDFDRRVFNIAEEYGACVSVYEIHAERAVEIVDAHVYSSCVLHNLENSALKSKIYEKSIAENFCVERVTLSDKRTGTAAGESIICAKRIVRDSGEFIVMLNCEIAPIGATMSTLTAQLVWITAILLVGAAILALIISKHLSSPITQMNRDAARLAEGRYDVVFKGGKYLEADELADTLNYAALELSKLDRMQKELIANISHDLRTPLTMIEGYGEVMRDIPGEMSAENMQVIIDETRRLSLLVNDLLDLSRLTSGTQELKTERFSLTGTITETLKRYTQLVEKDGYNITFEHNCEVFVCADKTRILQVIYNLINNALNYTGEDKSVTITQSICGGVCRISVSDTGDGIPKDKLALIWDRYYRTGDYHRRAQVGTGLGLSIVKNILLMHNARFGVSSAEGQGSVFWFELEISPSTIAEPISSDNE